MAAIAIQTLGTHALAQQAGFGSLDSEVVKHLAAAIYEVVVPKIEDTTTKYDRELPFERLPFAVRSDKYNSLGTAFRIGPRRFVSAAHVFNAQVPTLWTDFSLRATNGDVVKVGKVTRYSTSRDLVEFEAEGELRETTELATTEQSNPGELIFAVGNALGEGISFRGGQIASYTPDEVDGAFEYIRFSAPASPGNSGGPLVDTSGKVVGVVVRKTEAENLNFAVPIRELDKLSTGEAELLQQDSPILPGFDTPFKRWRFTAKLPSTYAEIAKSAQASFHDDILKNAHDMVMSSRPKFLPDDEAFRLYLRHQQSLVSSFFGALKKVPDGSWTVEEADFGKRAQQFMHGRAYGKDVAYIVKPPEISTQDFVENPQWILDAILTNLPRYRHFNGVDARITSLGKPASVTVWEDLLGRPWIEARWPLSFANMLWATQCHLTPQGAVCLVTQENVGAAAMALDLNRYIVPLFLINYIGSVDEWRAYLTLDKKYLSRMMHGARISIDNGQQLTFAFDKYTLTYQSANQPHVDTLTVALDYSPMARLALAVQEIDVTDGDYHNSVAPMFSPLAASSKWHKDEWRKVTNAAAAYNGHVVTDKFRSEIYKVLADRWPTATADLGFEGRYILHCEGQPQKDPKTFTSACEHFASGIKIKAGQ